MRGVDQISGFEYVVTVVSDISSQGTASANLCARMKPGGFDHAPSKAALALTSGSKQNSTRYPGD